jgi:hypothetical protein
LKIGVSLATVGVWIPSDLATVGGISFLFIDLAGGVDVKMRKGLGCADLIGSLHCKFIQINKKQTTAVELELH